MKNTILSAACFLILSGGVTLAHADHQHQAQEIKVTLDFDDLHIRSRRDDNTIKLKQALRHQKGISARDYNIKAAVLVAKSKQGHGKAQLVVGPTQTNKQGVDGSPREFHDYALESYDIVPFVNDTNQSNGKWQIHVFGNFKIKKVVLLLEKKSNRRGGRGRFGIE